MNLIVAILLWLGAITNAHQATPEVIQQNQGAIQNTLNDPTFQEFYSSQLDCTGVIVSDLSELD